MTTILYIMTYPFLWLGLLSFGLAFCRMRISKHRLKLVLAIFFLSTMCVVLQYYNQAYLFGILQPVALTICFWLIFKFRPFHALLVSLAVFASGVLSEILTNSIMAGFHFEKALYYQQNDIAITPIFIGLHHLGLYALFHKLRIGFSFIAPTIQRGVKSDKFSRTWIILAAGLLFLLGMFNISVYFTNHLLVPITISFTVCWAVILFISYRKELEN